jgi:hypothetical protein
MKRLAKASDFIEYDGNVNLTSEFRKTAAQVLDVILNQAADIIFRDRLLDTMCIRQQSFAYQKSCRENKLNPPVDVVVVPPKSNSGSRTGSAYRVKIGFATTAPSTTRSQKIAPRKSLGVTPSDASTFLTTAFQKLHQEQEPLNTIFLPHELPTRPKISLGEKEHECPYCLTICPVADFTDSGWWYVYAL